MKDTAVRHAGVDWASAAHAVCVLDATGRLVERLEVAHSAGGLAELCRRLVRAGVCRVAIERPDGPVVDALMGAGLEVVVIASRQVRALRERYGAAGNKDDALDAYVLADTPRTDGARPRARLSERRLSAWLRANGHCGRAGAGELCRRLAEAPGGLMGDEGRARGAVTEAPVAVLVGVREQIAGLEARIAEQLACHPDGPILASLPRAGRVRAAALLVEIGDWRERSPSPESLAALAGVAPSTRASGRHRAVTFRWAADKKPRDALVDLAGEGRHANAWAADLYARARAHGKTHPHAERILARSWRGVIWRMWQDGAPYDPERHGALQRLSAVGA